MGGQLGSEDKTMRYFDCGQCGGKCCKFLTFPLNAKNDSDVQKYYALRGHVMRSKRLGKILVLHVPCENLSETGKCMNYDNRPDVCRNMNEKTLVKYNVPKGCKYDVTGLLGEDFGV